MIKELVDKKCKLLLVIVTIALICTLIVFGIFMTKTAEPVTDKETNHLNASAKEDIPNPDASAKEDTPHPNAPESLTHEGYTLEQVVVLSRHNIRSPLVGPDSVLSKITPHKWYKWSSPASQLSVRGGTLETSMGQYFRKWLESEKLFPENYQPDEEAVRIYANAKQRTIATAQFFTAGLLPTVNEDVEYHGEFDTMDPVFNPQLTYISDGYVKAAQEQIHKMYDDDIKDLADNYELISDVLDMEESSGVKDGTIAPFRTDDTVVKLEMNKEPAMEGSLKTACTVSDAITLQYYEESDPVKAAFGNSLSEEQWTEMADIKDIYNEVLFLAPLISYNVANPLLNEIYSEMNNKERQFTFLCGHDSNIGSVLSALDAAEYHLPGTIEQKTPIGVKLVFSKWKSKNDELFWDVDLVYQTAQQLRDVEILTEDDNPASVDIDLSGLEQNNDSLYTDNDLKGRLKEAIEQYDKIK